MTKPKLSDAVKPGANAGDTPAPAAGKPETSAAATDTPKTPQGDKGGDDDSDDDEPAASGSGSDTPDGPAPAGSAAAATDSEDSEPAAKNLEDFRAAFGHEQGSVYYSDQTPFVDACVSHMEAQAKTIDTQATQIATLTGQAKDLASTAHGADEPLALNGEGDDTNATQDGVGAFAAGLSFKGKKPQA